MSVNERIIRLHATVAKLRPETVPGTAIAIGIDAIGGLANGIQCYVNDMQRDAAKDEKELRALRTEARDWKAAALAFEKATNAGVDADPALWRAAAQRVAAACEKYGR